MAFLMVVRRRAANVNDSVFCRALGSEKLKPNGPVEGRDSAFKGGGLLCAVADRPVGGSGWSMVVMVQAADKGAK